MLVRPDPIPPLHSLRPSTAQNLGPYLVDLVLAQLRGEDTAVDQRILAEVGSKWLPPGKEPDSSASDEAGSLSECVRHSWNSYLCFPFFLNHIASNTLPDDGGAYSRP